MPELDTYDHGVFSWVDVSSTDFEGTLKFYSDMFGWEIQRGREEFGGYSMASLKGRLVAGSPRRCPRRRRRSGRPTLTSRAWTTPWPR